MTNKLTIYILIVLGAALAGFMAFKSFTNQAKIVKANGEYLYESTKTPFESSFGSKDDPTKVVFRKDGKVLTFNIPYKDINWEKSGNKLIANVDKTKSLAYSILKNNNNDPVGIKEEIILNEKPENNTFEFSINLDGLKPKKESGLWHFYTNDGNSLFYIPKPFMEDAGGQRNEDVQINIDDGKLTVTANKDWLNSNDRKYPIKIDPSLELTVLTVQSFPEEGDIWGVEFTTVGKSDLKITPNDQQTIDDMDFVSLTCGGQKMSPRILKDDVIYYRNWECSGIGKIEHKITKQGNHELKFEFGDQVAFAHNASWLGTWENRIKITVDNTNIDSDLTHFPIPIFLNTSAGQNSDDLSTVFDEVGSSYQKIAVTKDDGTTQIYVEKERWDDTAEEAVLWVSKSDLILSSGSTTTFYLYYDSTQSDNTTYVADVGSRTEVWKSAFLGVYHMSEASGNLIDSTSNSNDSTSSGGTPDYQQSGALGYAINFTGTSSEYFLIPDTAFGKPTAYTTSYQVKPTTWANAAAAYSAPSNGANAGAWGIQYDNDQEVHINVGNGSTYDWTTLASEWNSTNYPNSSFTLTHGVAQGNGNNMILYRSGSTVDTEGQDIANDTGTAYDFAIGKVGEYTSGYYFDGVIDEVRVANEDLGADWIKTDYYAQTDDLLTFSQSVNTDNWDNVMEITVDNTNIDSDLTHFPIPIFLNTSAGQSNVDVSGVFDEVGTNWQKIAVTKDDGTTQLYVEKEKWDATAEEAILWVSSSDLTLSSATTTTLYLYYDIDQTNNSLYVGDVGNAVNVWDSNYKAVWHMSESSGNIVDSTINDNDSSAANGSPSGYSATGQVGDAIDFDGSNDNFTVGTALNTTLHDDFTIEIQLKRGSTGTNDIVFGGGTSAANQLFHFGYRNTNKFTSAFYANDLDSKYYYTDTTNFHYFTGRYTDSSNYREIIVDGLSDNANTASSDFAGTGTLYVGSQGITASPMDGIIDELRISNTPRSDAYIKANYYAQKDNLLTLDSGNLQLNPSNWNHVIEITVDNTNIDSDLTHFPIPIFLNTSAGQSNVDVSGVFDEVGTNWQKIAVTKDDGTTQLYVEKEKWDATAEEAILWVSSSDLTLSSSATTTLYLYYDSTQVNNTMIADIGNAVSVWDSNYKAVWHMSESSGNIVDSTINDNDSSAANGSPSGYSATGQVGDAIDFDGSNDNFTIGSALNNTLRDDFTIETQLKRGSIGTNDYVFGGGTTTTNNHMHFGYRSTNKFTLAFYGNDIDSTSSYTDTTNFHYFTGRYTDSSNYREIIVDGLSDNTDTASGDFTGTGTLYVGDVSNPTNPMDGIIDELRISNTPRSDAYIKTNYYAQTDDLLTFTLNTAPSSPTSLQTEGSTNPTEVEITPEFSAIYNDSDVGDIANKYQIQVDDNSDFSSPIWDSGSSGTAMTNCTQGNRCSSIEYAGSNLSENTTYYWRIRFWDDTGDAGAWSGVVDWLGDWENRIEITVDNTNIDTDLTHFPIPIFLSTSAGQSSDDVSAVFDEVGASWQKIAVTKDDGTTQIYVEKEKWDDTGEEAVLWISKSDLTITNATTTTLYLYYDSNKSDNTSYVADIGGRTEVWNSDYAAVYHMGDSSGLTDSTSNNNDSSTTNGSPSYQQDMDGYKGYAVNFNGSTDYFLIPDSTDFTFTAGFTVEALYDPDNASRNETILRKYTYVDDAFNIYRQITPGPVEVFGLAVNNNWAYATKPMSGAEQYIVGRRDESGGGTDIFRDASKTAGSVQAGTIDSANTLGIGATESGGSYFDGRIAEIRISGITRSDAWIKASHYAQTDNLIEFNSPETVPFNTFTIVQAPSSCKIKEIAQNGSNFDITVEWTDNSSNETGFEVDRSADGGAYSNITTTAADAIEYTDINVPTGSDYTYRMRAVISGGYSYWCTTNDFDLETGITQIEGNIKLEGVNIN